MLQWMLKRGDNVDDAGDADTTQIDQPDTPAPVFAARAFKRAVFGTPVPQEKPGGKARISDRGSGHPELSSIAVDTPSKPQGILLTPGTGTTRRKKVSFRREGQSKSNIDHASSGAKPEMGTQQTRADGGPQRATRVKEKQSTGNAAEHPNASDSEWEEEDDDGDRGNVCNHDITLDLNDPHSQSGRYWKEEFQKYHADAKMEMEKLLQYKQLAKSYAQQKDMEAIQLAEMLKAEQQKVIKMEKRIASNALQMVSQQQQSSSGAPAEIIAKLTKQTALSVQYRKRVQELEDHLGDFLRERDAEIGDTPRKRRQTASPRTQSTLMETRRELRRARAQVKELGDLREEVRMLKSQLRAAERKAKTNAYVGVEVEGDGRAGKLYDELKLAKQESKRKDEELKQLIGEFDSFRAETEAHDSDSKAVLERAHTKIADLKKEIKALKAAGPIAAPPDELYAETYSDKKIPSPRKRNSAGIDLGTTSERSRKPLRELHGIEDRHISRRNSRSPAKRLADIDGLREQYNQDDVNQTETGGIFSERPELEKPKWQPFVPRSPRNRNYLGERLEKKIENGGVTPVAFKSKDSVKASSRRKASTSRKPEPDLTVDSELDVLREGFKRHVSGQSDLLVAASKSSIPPERRAAAMARIEKRMADRRSSRPLSHRGQDKENVRP